MNSQMNKTQVTGLELGNWVCKLAWVGISGRKGESNFQERCLVHKENLQRGASWRKGREEIGSLTEYFKGCGSGNSALLLSSSLRQGISM